MNKNEPIQTLTPLYVSRCCCGRSENWQGHIALGVPLEERWHPYRHTEAKVTDAYGVLEFQGAPHPSKAQVCVKDVQLVM